MNQPTHKKRYIPLSLSQFFKRFCSGLLRDFFRGGVVFFVVFVLMMLHLTQTIKIAPLEWLLSSSAKDVAPLSTLPASQKEILPQQEAPHEEAMESSVDAQHSAVVPNLLP